MEWQIIGGVSAALAILGSLATWFFRRGLPALRKWSRFADRVMGVPADARTGQKEIPGIFERMDAQDAVLETIRHEVEYNNGTSVKDGIRRLENQGRERAQALETLGRKLDDHLAPTPQTQININQTPPEASP